MGREDKTTSQIELDKGDSEEYEVEAIHNDAVYGTKLEDHLPGCYYLVLWKSYSKGKNTWEYILAVLHLCKLINTFYQDHPENL